MAATAREDVKGFLISGFIFALVFSPVWLVVAVSADAQGPQPPEQQQGTTSPPADVPVPERPPIGKIVVEGPKRFTFKFDPDITLADLLPYPPQVKMNGGPILLDDLARIPEIQFQEPLSKDLPDDKALEMTAHTIAKINHVNAKKTDAFMEVLLGKRPDLSGLPVAMGDACRTGVERSKFFRQAVETIRSAMQPNLTTRIHNIESFRALFSGSPAPGDKTSTSPDLAVSPPPAEVKPPLPPLSQPVSSAPAVQPPPASTVVATVSENRTEDDLFWDRYRKACEEEDKAVSKIDQKIREHITQARIAALMQVLGPEQPSLRLGLVKHLSTIAHVEATKALARLALYSAESEVRQAALDALKVRRERDYTDLLVDGLRYPWPAVAKHASEALVKLERKDLLAQLVEVLDRPDPRAPAMRDVEGRNVPVVNELVRINHHRNCLLCHAPVGKGGAPDEVMTVGVPLPTQPLSTLSSPYRTVSPDIIVRIDVVYLRQDFSMMQPVKDAHPWPEMQRFDFVVRSRELSETEAVAWRKHFDQREPGFVSPYHRAALFALRELTGKDTAPTAEAWRQLLNLPPRGQAELSATRR